MRRFLVSVFCLLGVSAFSQPLLKKGESYFSINGDSLRNERLYEFHKAAWDAVYAGKIPAYSALPVNGGQLMDKVETQKCMNYDRIATFTGIADWNFGESLPPDDITYIKTLTLNDELWIIPMYVFDEDESLPVVHYKMNDVEKVLDKALCAYATETFNGLKTTYTANETREAMNYRFYAYSIASLMDSLYQDILHGQLKAYDYGSGQVMDVSKVSDCLKEPIFMLDPETFEEYDAMIVISFSEKFYGIQLHPQWEVDASGKMVPKASEYITVLIRSSTLLGNDFMPIQAYSLKISDMEQRMDETEKKIWDDFIAGKSSGLACIPSSVDNVIAINGSQKKALVELFKKIAEDGLAGKISLLDTWDGLKPLTVEVLRTNLIRKEILFQLDEQGIERETEVETAVELDSLRGIRIERYWRPTAKPGEFEVYKWFASPMYPMVLASGELIFGYVPYSIDITEMTQVYGKETMAPLQKFFDENTKYESDLFEYMDSDDGNYFFKRIKTGETVSVVNAEPDMKPGDTHHFTYIKQNPDWPSDYVTVYALRRSKAEGK